MRKAEEELKEKFVNEFKSIESQELKQGALAVMAAYVNGVMEERARWEEKQKTA